MIAGKFVVVLGTSSAAISNTVQYVHFTVLQIGRHTWEYHRAAISNTVQYVHCPVLQIRSCMFADNRTWDYQCCYQQYSTVRTMYCTSNWTSCMFADNRTTSYIVKQPRKKRNEKNLSRVKSRAIENKSRHVQIA
jgi:hypothetical protein